LVFTTETLVINKKCKKKELSFLEQVVNISKSFNIDFIGQPFASAVFNTVPEKATYIPWGSYVVDLTQDQEILFKNIHSKHRNVIRKAMKSGILIKEVTNVKLIFDILKNTMVRLNRSYPSLNELEKIMPFSKFYVAFKDDVPQGCAVLPYNKLGVYYLYGGSIQKPFTGSLNLMHYTAMLDFKSIGVLQYDFMGARLNVSPGSKLEGIQRFKKRFGGKLRTGFLWKYEFRPYKVKSIYFIQKFIYCLQNKKYVGDAIDQELFRYV
jgi:lipid II:glycine glycyltransferase (peptidoglycan interpeptide bridge formation enzyme)